MANASTHPWTDERTERAKALWLNGLSAGEIAREMRCTRGAVIGRLNRLGLRNEDRGCKGNQARTRLPDRSRPGPKPKKAPQGWFVPRVRAPRPKPFISEAVMHKPTCEPIDLFALTNTTCRFPVSDSAPWQFCGHPSADLAEDRPYCGFHRSLAYDAPRKLNPKRPALERAA